MVRGQCVACGQPRPVPRLAFKAGGCVAAMASGWTASAWCCAGCGRRVLPRSSSASCRGVNRGQGRGLQVRPLVWASGVGGRGRPVFGTRELGYQVPSARCVWAPPSWGSFLFIVQGRSWSPRWRCRRLWHFMRGSAACRLHAGHHCVFPSTRVFFLHFLSADLTRVGASR